MKGDFQAHQTRFPRLQSDGMRRRAISGAAVGGEPLRESFTTRPALSNDVLVEPRQPIHTSAESIQRRQLSDHTPSQYDWQNPEGGQAPPGYPVPQPVYQSRERYLPNAEGNYTIDPRHVPLNPVNRETRPPYTPISRPRAFSYGHAHGTEYKYYPSSDENSTGAGRPYLPFENIAATRALSSGPQSPQLIANHSIVECPPIQEGVRRDLCSSPYSNGTSAPSSSAAYDGRQHGQLSPGRPASMDAGYATPVEPRQSNMGARLIKPRTPNHKVVHPSPGITPSSSSYHRDRGDEQQSDRDARVLGMHSSRTQLSDLSEYSGTTSSSGVVTPSIMSQSSFQGRASHSLGFAELKKAGDTRRQPAVPSFYTQSLISMGSTPTNTHQGMLQTASSQSANSLYDRKTKGRAMSTRSTLITPDLTDSEYESEGEDSILVPALNKIGRVYEDLGIPLTPQLERAVRKSSPFVTSDVRDRVICAISESRSASVIGIAVVNITTRTVDLARVLNNDRYLYQLLGDTLWKLMPLGPEKIVVVENTTNTCNKNWLIPHLENDFPGVPVVPVDRKHWSEEEGHSMIERFALRDQVTALQTDLEGHYYTWCAFSAAISFVQGQLGIYFTRNSLRVAHVQAVNTMGLDRATVSSLELLQNTRAAASKKSTLFGILNHTLTPQGQRLLRTTLLQPSTAREEMMERYESIEELSTKEGLLGQLREALRDLVRIDFERITLWLSQEPTRARQPLEQGLPAGTAQGVHLSPHLLLSRAEQDVNNILMLKAYLLGVKKLHDVINAAGCTSRLLRWIKDRFSQEHIEPIKTAVEEMIADDVTYSNKPIDLRNNRIWAVKAEDNEVLDQARSSYKTLTNELGEYFKILECQFDGMLGSIKPPKLKLDRNWRYCIQFDCSDVENDLKRNQSDVEKEKFGRICRWSQATIAGIDVVDGVRDKKHFTCTTTKLLQWSTQIQLQADIVTQESDRKITELIKTLQQHPGGMFDISDAVALLDMLCSFTQVATTKDYVRPMITETMVLKAARNPIVEIRKEQFVANDVYSGDISGRFQVITGGNMSGKSTFIRLVALIQIMAQMGSFVPAQFASISICDRVFARVSTGDAPENNMGTFGVEMRETDVILKMATRQSLIIMDELGRGTSPEDGLPLATSVSEGLILEGSRVFFATHFTELARILNGFYHRDVLNVHFPGLCRTGFQRTRTPITEIKLPHTLAGGPVQSEDYGIELARCILSEWAVDRAENILQILRDSPMPPQSDRKAWQARLNKILLALPPLIKESMQSRMDDAALGSYLKRLMTEFTIKMSEPEDGTEVDMGDENGEVEKREEDVELHDAEELNRDEDLHEDTELDDARELNEEEDMPEIEEFIDDEEMPDIEEFIDGADGIGGFRVTDERRAPEADMGMDIDIADGHWSSSASERRAPEANMGIFISSGGQKRPAEDDDDDEYDNDSGREEREKRMREN